MLPGRVPPGLCDCRLNTGPGNTIVPSTPSRTTLGRGLRSFLRATAGDLVSGATNIIGNGPSWAIARWGENSFSETSFFKSKLALCVLPDGDEVGDAAGAAPEVPSKPWPRLLRYKGANGPPVDGEVEVAVEVIPVSVSLFRIF